MRTVAGLIADVLSDVESEAVRQQTRKRVSELTDAFPLYSWKREVKTALVG
jgi:glycine/serine hydroxymethyltransferase